MSRRPVLLTALPVASSRTAFLTASKVPLQEATYVRAMIRQHVPDIYANSDLPPGPDASFAHWLESNIRWVYIVAFAAALFWTAVYLQFTVDDAFISFRYGKNLALHHIWNWNLSGPHEEAYTSVLYTAIGILPALLHLSPALFFKCFGLACVGAMVYRLRTESTTSFAFLLGLLLIGLDPWTWLHAYAGLETPLYMLLLLEMAICVHRAATTPASWVYTIFVLLPLARPEGVVFACVGVALFWSRRGRAPRHYAVLAGSVLLGLVYFFVRWHYFRHLLPNPYYYKLALLPWSEMRTKFLLNLTDYKGYFLVLLLILIFARKWYTRILTLCGLMLLLVLYAPHDMDMNYAERFYFQVTFPLVLFFLIAEDVVPIARTAAFAAVLCLFSTSPQDMLDGLGVDHYTTKLERDLGRALAPFDQTHTLLTPSAGLIPYYSNWMSYDYCGLGTYRIARNGLSEPLLKEIHPDLILIENPHPGPGVLLEPTSNSPPGSPEINLLLHSSEYEYVGDAGSHNMYLLEFLRKETPQHDEIVRALRENMRVSANDHMSIKDLLLQKYVPWSN